MASRGGVGRWVLLAGALVLWGSVQSCDSKGREAVDEVLGTIDALSDVQGGVDAMLDDAITEFVSGSDWRFEDSPIEDAMATDLPEDLGSELSDLRGDLDGFDSTEGVWSDLNDASDLSDLSGVDATDSTWDVPDGTGQPCEWEGDCPEGFDCIELPCDFCGVPPQPVCLPSLCPGGCYTDGDCWAGNHCVEADPWAGKIGLCLDNTQAPFCWEDADCPDVARCEGALHCPVCVDCDMMTKHGQCAPDNFTGVLLWVKPDMYMPGATVPVAWYNFTAQPVYLPGCSTYNVEWKDESVGEWVDQGATEDCLWEGVAVKIEPGQGFQAQSWFGPGYSEQGWDNYRLSGVYYLGCLDGEPLSTAACEVGPLPAVSDVFTVSYVFPP